MFVRFGSRFRSVRLALAGAVAVAVTASLAGSIELPARPGPARPEAAAPPKVGELPERRTASSATRRNRDGSMTTTVYGAPVHYRAADGSWQPIDSTLYRADEGGYAWRSGANAFQARFKDSAEAGFSELRIGERVFRMTAEGAAPSKARVDGSKVSYPGAFPGADLTYAVTAIGVKEIIELAGPDSPVEYSFRLSAVDGGPPMSVQRRQDGSYAVNAPPLPGSAFTLDVPVVHEATGGDRLAPPAPEARPNLRVDRSGGDLLLRLSLDEAWLRAPGRRFPVLLDPTVTIQPNVDDGYYRTEQSASLVGADWLAMGSTINQTYRSVLRFDLSSVPAGAQVTDAKLSLYYNGGCLGVQGNPCAGWPQHVLDAHRMTSWWNSSVANSPLTFDPSMAATYTLQAGDYPRWMVWPVTSTVGAWVAGTAPNYGFLLKRHTESYGSSGPVVGGMRSTGPADLKPKIEVNYVGEAVDLLEPTTLHADGAELAWTRYAGPAGVPFAKYEVHRGTGAFTPTAATLLTTIRDAAITTYRDTTAAPDRTFSYRIVANTTPSNVRTVTLPSAGQARKVLQPVPGVARAAGLRSPYSSACANYGAEAMSWVGTSSAVLARLAVYFDLRDIPADATIISATASVFQVDNFLYTAGTTVQAHRITRPWKEGTGQGTCTGDGATWLETEGGQSWSSQGGDYEQAYAARVDVAYNAPAAFHNFLVTDLVQSWAAGSAPNNGFLLRTADETLRDYNSVVYATDDDADATRRPKLTIAYSDASAASGPRVSLAAPAAGARVSGQVRLASAAEDDRRVDLVEFLVNGSSVGSDAVAPFEITWNSAAAGVGNGSKTVTVRATDDAGNQSVSAPVNITVDNTAVPSGAVSAPAAGATVGGDVTLSATASDDVGVASVAFLVDGVRVGAPDDTAPYSVVWKTLDPLAPAFNGSRQLTALVTDTSGQQVVTEARTVTVNNLGANPYQVDFKLNDPASTVDDVFPTVMPENTAAGVPVQDPYATVPLNADGTSGGSLGRALGSAPQDDGGTPPPSCPANAYCPTVTVVNTSGVAWTGSTAQVWYRWYAPNGAVMFEGRSTTTFPATFAAGTAQAFPVTIYPPALPPGVQQGTYRLRIDVHDPATATWFAAKGNPPLDNPIIVAKALATKLGFERFHQYEGEPVGAGMSTMTNIANGDLLWRWSPMFSPGRGLATMVDLTYNSLEDHSKSPAGNNVSLSISGLIRLGEPLDIHPNKADEISGQSNKWVEFVDSDGTTHRFIGTTGGDGITRWTEPPGVNLYLRSLPVGDPRGRWALTRPDKVTFFFDVDGFPTMVEDRNGNRITFVLEDTPPGEDPGGPKKRIIRVTDPSDSRSFVVDYWSKDEAKKAHVRGKIQQIRDHSGSRLDFFYYDDGNLRKLIQRGGLNANGTPLDDRSFVFTYTTSNGAGPAIPNAADRVDPAEKVSNQSTRIFSIRDPRGAETTVAYYQANEGQHLRWKLKSRTNRDGKTTTLAYDLTNRVTTVTAPLSRVTSYTYDVTGKVTRITNPLSQNTDVEWSPDFKVTKVIEPTGQFTRYAYNANGYPTLNVSQLGEETVLTYVNSPVDVNDVGNHLSQLDTVTRPRGVLTPDPADFQWTYTYDGAGNVDRVTDPTGAVTDYDFNLAGSANPGTVSAIRDANGNPPTLFEAYDPSGQPTRIKDPLAKVTQMGYTPDGQVRWIQDPNHAADTGTSEREYKTFFDYDEFGRLGRQSAPKSTSTARGRLLWSSVEYDPNDNTVRAIGGHFGEATGDPENGPVTTSSYDVMDRPVLVSGPDRSADPAGERILYDYDDAGRLEKLVNPRGMQTAAVTDDFTTRYEYDALDRVRHVTGHGLDTTAGQTRHTHACYDVAGDLRSVTTPRSGLTSVTCPGTGPATAPFTATFSYDVAHRLTSQKDPLGHETRMGYDPNGNATSQEADIAPGRVARTQTDFDQRDLPELIRERFDGTTARDAVTKIEYDANGNRKKVRTPRAVEAATAGQPTHYVNELGYDSANRLTKVTLPFNGSDGAERQYVHNAYDANGNVLWTSLPVTSSDPAAVADTARTVMTYFDPGWIRTSDDPANPKVHFDYTALGLQASRTPEMAGAPGQLDPTLSMSWTYHPDNMLASRSDRGGQSSTFHYDAHNNLVVANDADGVADPSQKPVDVEASYTGFDEPARSRFRRDGETAWTFSDYTYDANGNTTGRRENGQETGPIDSPTQTKAPRRYEMTYDGADWLATQLDLGVDDTCKDDQRIVNTFYSTGWEKQRDIHRAGTGCSSDPVTWPKKQTSTWTHFNNGLLRQLETVNSGGTVTESHDVGYFDAAGIYVNGNRTRDTYVLKRGEGSTATTCLTVATACQATYTYDARDRLVNHQQRAGVTTAYTLDQPAQLIGDTTVRAGNVTTETKSGVTTTRRYQANQLKEATSGGVTAKYWYTPLGDLDCITTSAGSQANCSPPEGATASNLIADHTYDYLSRLIGTRQFSGGSTQTDEASYVYDPLDRTVTETEDHLGTGKDRDMAFTYQGLSGLVTEEKQTGGTDPKTKTFAYDAYGHRISMSDTNSAGTTNTYTYGHDVHGSVSQLINDAGGVKASYGYDAYGGSDAPAGDAQSLTAGDTDAQAPLNPFRYTGRRIDSGQATSASSAAGYDMGARRYGPDVGRFLQQDMFAGALSDLGLSLDPLTQNRYALAGGNPISFIEFDGHMTMADGGGGGSVNPAPPPPPPPGKAEKLFGIFGDRGRDFGRSLDDLDRRTIHNPDSPWHTVYQTSNAIESKIEQGIHDTATNTKECVTGNVEGCKALESGAEDLIGITDANKCLTEGDRASCAWTAISLVPFGRLGKLFKYGDEAADARRGADEAVAGACSFSAATLVLMADGTKKPISEIEVGDEVVATDPETGEKGTRTVTHVWVHEDELVTLEIDGHAVTTTEDHPFWNDTDRQWQRADQLDPGETVLSANGGSARVSGIRPGTGHTASAYNLTVDDIHTYYVVAGSVPVLVHNTQPGCGIFSNRLDNIATHITQRDLSAAARELRGEVVARKSGGTPWDHVHEVRDAQNGLIDIISRLNRMSGNPNLSPAERAAISADLSRASRMLDYTEKYVPRN